jgi:hypothetical protein
VPLVSVTKAVSVAIAGRRYPVILPSLRDPRLHLAAVLLTLQAFGQAVLGFRLSIAQILVCLAVGALIELVVAFFRDGLILWPASGLLTGNSTAFILRVPGTVHGQWWSLHGIWIFVGVVALSMASKYLVRWRGRHVFNPSNLGLVVAFVALGPRYTEPLDLWWAPLNGWMLAAYAILIAGGLLVGRELKLVGLMLGFLLGFATFAALALGGAPDHCMVAGWQVAPMCGATLWQVLVTSPEILLFGFFMVPDPRTVPDGPLARVLFGLLVALLAVLLIGPTTLEFWTKTAILASLVVACALRFGLAALVAPLEAAGGLGATLRRAHWRLPFVLALALVMIEALPVSADLATQGTDPAAGRTDGSTAALAPPRGAGPDPAGWLDGAAAAALPRPGQVVATAATARVWVLPALPPVAVDDKVTAFDRSITPGVAARMERETVLDLVIEAEARRAHDPALAATGASGDGLQPFLDATAEDAAAGQSVQTTYRFEKATLTLFLPRFSTQASRLVGVTLQGSMTVTTRDGDGRPLSRTTSAYARSWGLNAGPGEGHWVIVNDFTGLAPA